MEFDKPRWWVLYATVPLMIAGVFFILRSNWADWAKTTAAIVIVLITFVAMAMWMNANEGSIQHAELVQERRTAARRRRALYASRTRSISVPAPRNTVPSSGFGSARFRPQYTYELEPQSGGRVRIVKHINSSLNKAY